MDKIDMVAIFLFLLALLFFALAVVPPAIETTPTIINRNTNIKRLIETKKYNRENIAWIGSTNIINVYYKDKNGEYVKRRIGVNKTDAFFLSKNFTEV